jgi:outer membrane immunogenic protein
VYGYRDFAGPPMKNTAIGIAFIAALIGSPAWAADIPLKAPPLPPPTWTGWYAGVNVGYGWGRGEDTVTGLPFAVPPATAFNVQIFDFDHNPNGWLGGVQLGYNWQMNNFVAGVETDIDPAGMKGSGSFSPLSLVAPAGPFPGTFQTGQEQIQWFGTLRGRLGFLPNNNLLLYGTGGLAYGQVKISELECTAPSCAPGLNFTGSQTDWRAGWTAGAGAEWAIAPKWTLKAEYLHFDLGSTTFFANSTPVIPPFTSQNVVKTSGDIVRAGVNYRF